MKDKEQTKRKLIRAVGEIVKNEGFSELKISTIAKRAEVDRKLIYRYFGGIDRLIEAYVIENDYWMTFSDNVKDMVQEGSDGNSKALITAILQDQFKTFLSSQEMQKLILFELTAKSPLMKSIHNVRESMGREFLELTDANFKHSKVNFRAISALLVGGIYYTILHTKFNGGIFADIDISSEAGQQEILKAIEQIVDWALNGQE